ncbi:MAG TPA: hypothetical protein VEI97_08980, partial [bacterium]|nr:hypothetical protein [bacterium]
MHRYPGLSLSLLLTCCLAVPAPSQEPAPPDPAPITSSDSAADNPWAPDTPEPGSVEAIREYTTDAKYLPESVAYVPESATVPSPTEVLGHLVGAPDVLSRVADVHGYFRRLDEASDRVRVVSLGTSEEGR